MELLRLLTHGKLGGGGATRPAATTTISTSVLRTDSDDGDGGGDDDDEGPFFDLEFALPLRRNEMGLPREKRSSSDAESDGEEGEVEEFDLTVRPDSGSLRRDSVLSISGSIAASELPRSSSKAQVPAFLLKSAAKFRVFKLVFHRRWKSALSEPNPSASPATMPAFPKQQEQNKFFVEFKAEEVPLVVARDNSWRSNSSGSRSARLYSDDGLPASEDRKLPRYMLQRYINKIIRPLYIRISKRYGEKVGFSGPLSSGGAGKVRALGEMVGDQFKEPASAASSIKGSLRSQDGLRVVCRRLRKSRSASAAVASVRSPPFSAGRRDDSLLEYQDGIQSAIAHCKRSFNRGSESPLMRSRSDPGNGRSMEFNSSSSSSSNNDI